MPNLFKYVKFPPSLKDFFFGGEFWSGWFYGFIAGLYVGAGLMLISVAFYHFLIWGGFKP